MYYVYILKNKEGKHYIGHTNNLQRRVKDHNYGKSKWTKKKGPWYLIYNEMFSTRNEASLRERQIKKLKGGKAFKALITKV